MITHTITGFELAWTITALIGFVFAARLLRRAVGDYDFVTKNKFDGLREYSAWTTVFIFLGGNITQLSYVLVGCIAMTQPSLHQKITTANIFTSTIFLTASLISTAFAGIIYHRRVKIVEMLDKIDEERDSGTK